MKFYIATDHAGVELKNFTRDLLRKKGHSVEDLGPQSRDRVDYPDFAHKLSEKVISNSDAHGILICGTGIGMSMSANTHKGIRAALCHDAYTVQMARQHNDANILCFGERVVGKGIVESMLDTWLKYEFEGGRHANRVAKIEKA